MVNPNNLNRLKEVYASAARYCSSVERCEFEVRKKLNQWHVDIAMAQEVIERLQQDKFIDEKRYAHAFVKDKFNLNGWGRVKIRHHLGQKNISKKAIEDGLNDQMDEELYQQKLYDLLDKKRRTLKEDDAYKKRAKLVQFAQSRGFEISLALDLLDQLE